MPQPVRTGYYALGKPSPFPAGTFKNYDDSGMIMTVYDAAEFCPVGSYCPGIQRMSLLPSTPPTLWPCPSGTYGVTELATLMDMCAKCAVGTYLAESGRAVLADGSSPCLPCPEGTRVYVVYTTTSEDVIFENVTKFCEYSFPGEFMSSGRKLQCPPGTASFIGASSCFPLRDQDSATSSSFQRARACHFGQPRRPDDPRQCYSHWRPRARRGAAAVRSAWPRQCAVLLLRPSPRPAARP